MTTKVAVISTDVTAQNTAETKSKSKVQLPPKHASRANSIKRTVSPTIYDFEKTKNTQLNDLSTLILPKQETKDKPPNDSCFMCARARASCTPSTTAFHASIVHQHDNHTITLNGKPHQVTETSDQSNLTHKADSPPHIDGSIVYDMWHQRAPHLIHASFPPPESASQTPKWHLDRFSHFCTAHGRVLILYNGPPLLPLKIVVCVGGFGSPFNTRFRGPT